MLATVISPSHAWISAAADGQAEARSALAALGRDQRIEDPADDVGGDALAVVAHPDHHALALFRDRDPDVPAFGHGVAGVEQDVGQNLLQIVRSSRARGPAARRRDAARLWTLMRFGFSRSSCRPRWP